jgi:hypothetical protein
MTAFKEIRIGAYVLRFWPSDNGWMCGITPEMMDAIEQAEKQEPVEMPPIKFSQVANGIEVGYDLFGGVDIRLGGEFVYVHINYNYKYTDNATRTHLANSIVELLTNKPQREWVGLTEKEVAGVLGQLSVPPSGGHALYDWAMQAIRAIEAKLKEKNT